MKSILTLLCAALFLGLAVTAGSAQAARKSVSAAEVNGTFRMPFTGKFKGSSNEIKILALGGGKLRIAMELLYPYIVNGELSANMGELDGQAAIVGDVAVYDSSENGGCTITIKFVRPGIIKVTQEGMDFACGFGHNVFADGTYKKVSSAKPTFEENQ